VEDLNDIYQVIDCLTVDEIDALPYGSIQLDEEGYILKYNTYESQLARLSKETVLGKNFFSEVAPCTDVQEFHGRFKEGVQAKQLHTRFQYEFQFVPQPRNVIVTLFYSMVTSSVWVFVQPIDK
jgi:photoactive yellow protein